MGGSVEATGRNASALGPVRRYSRNYLCGGLSLSENCRPLVSVTDALGYAMSSGKAPISSALDFDLPHVDSIGLFLQCNPCEGNVTLDLIEDGDILVTKVVIFWTEVIRNWRRRRQRRYMGITRAYESEHILSHRPEGRSPLFPDARRTQQSQRRAGLPPKVWQRQARPSRSWLGRRRSCQRKAMIRTQGSRRQQQLAV